MIDFPRLHKIIRDVWDNKPRTILTVLAITVGVFAFGGMFITRDVLLTNMNDGFADTNPAHVTLTLRPFESSLTRTAATFPEVEMAEARASAQVEMWSGSEWVTVDLIAVPDYTAASINTLNVESGTLPPERREIVLERESITLIEGGEVGSTVLIELPDGTQQEATIGGIVHDFNVVPATRVPILTGYVSMDTMRLWGLDTQYDTLQIITPYETRAEVEVASDVITNRLESYGYIVLDSLVTPPGRHWAADFVEATVLMLSILGFMALALSAFLVINTVMAILAQQKRQIGMMKAIGAQLHHVMGIYLGLAAVYGVLALFIALPLGIVLSRVMTRLLADFLNITIVTFEVAPWIIALQVVTALITPLLAALVPVWSGAQTTVREAIDDYGIGTKRGHTLIDRLLARVKRLPRPVMLSLRNTFRRKVRLALTLIALSTAGAIFISVLVSRVSLLGEFDHLLGMFGFDAQIILSEPESVTRLDRLLSEVEGVENVEGWAIMPASIIPPEGGVADAATVMRPNQGRAFSYGGSDIGAGTAVTIFAPPLDSAYIDANMIEGRWLEPGDTYAVVVSSEILISDPYITVGDSITLDVGTTTRQFEVVGIVNLPGGEFVYAPFDTVTRLDGAVGWSSAAAFGVNGSTNIVTRAAEEHLGQIGMTVNQTFTPDDLIGVITSQIDFFVVFMLFMAGLLGVVGGLGLASTMSLNVLERTREIGVMRAIGASNGAIRRIVMVEGVLIGLMSFVFAAMLSLPLSMGIVSGLGLVFFNRPLELTLKPSSYAFWLAIVLVLAIVSSLLPAHRAAQISVRESLSYE